MAGTGQEVDVSSGSHSFSLGISDQLLQQLNFRSTGSYSVAWLNAQIQPAADEVYIPCAHASVTRVTENCSRNVLL